jgi:hypothetical protein
MQLVPALLKLAEQGLVAYCQAHLLSLLPGSSSNSSSNAQIAVCSSSIRWGSSHSSSVKLQAIYDLLALLANSAKVYSPFLHVRHHNSAAAAFEMQLLAS